MPAAPATERSHWSATLPLPLDEPPHQLRRLVGQERPAEHLDAQIDRFVQRQLLLLPQQVLLRAQCLRAAGEQRGDRSLHGRIEPR